MPRPDRRGGPTDVTGLPGQPGVGNSNDEMSRFVRRVLADTEDVWDQIFKGAGRRYEKPTLVLFTGATRTACGTGQSAMGPFYCPADRKVYIDLAFYDELKRRFNAPGDFAQAYVIAHEIGHHVQAQLVRRQGAAIEAARARSRPTSCRSRWELLLAGACGRRSIIDEEPAAAGDVESGPAAADRATAAEEGTGLRSAGVLHTRQLGPARALVQARAGHWSDAGVRHVQRQPVVRRLHAYSGTPV
jgi:predicted metalloprotease